MTTLAASSVPDAVASHLGWRGRDQADAIRAHAFEQADVEHHPLVSPLVRAIVERSGFAPESVRAEVVRQIWGACLNNPARGAA